MADDAELPYDLRAFLYSRIETIEKAQIVMRLQASEGAWTARTIARDLALNDSIARRHRRCWAGDTRMANCES